MFKYFYHIHVVVGACCFSHRVHSEQWATHVHAFYIELTGENIAQSRASGYVGMVYEILIWRADFDAKALENSSRMCIGHIFAISVNLNYRAAADCRVIGGIVLLAIVGVIGMGIIS